jgi:FtsP/CotA-like multicopper oxidase with cupredoxin domain
MREKLFDGFLLMLTVMGVLIAAIAVVGIATRPAPAATQPAGPAGEASGTAEPVVAHIELTEFAIRGDLTVPPGEVVLEVHNQGSVIHNVALEGGPVSADIGPGESTNLELGRLEPGTYTLFCAIPGHREAGMVATLTVSADAAPPTGESVHGHGEEVDWAELDRMMQESILRFPAETEGRGAQPLEPVEVLDDGTKVFEITAAITPWEVEPGKVVDAWTYNGMVPGPLIRVDVGDRVRVVVHNELPMGTDVHWHGIDTPNSMDGVAPLTQPLIQPGETFVYEFVAEEPAVGMYHAHHHGQMQVPNGMFAPFIIGEVPLPAGRTISGIEIPADLEVVQEIPMVLNDAGVIGFSLNGKSFPATEPYVFRQGDWFLVHYYNEGLQIHPMHLHQFPQLVVAKDGIPLEEPYWADTLNVAPGERYTVLVQASDPGVWVWHCHILNHVEKEEGMFGMVTAVIVEEA